MKTDYVSLEVELKGGRAISNCSRSYTRLIQLPCLMGVAILIALAFCPVRAAAQNLEVGGGYVHVTGDFGLDGFNVGAAWWFNPRVAMAFDFDSAYDTSNIGTFELTSTGGIAVKNHIINYLVGPRVFFSTKKIKKYKIDPFAEFQIGGSHLNSKLDSVTSGSQSASDNAFTWLLGGGADYKLSPSWTARMKLDLLRTHFVDQGQSRLRLGLGVAYTFGK